MKKPELEALQNLPIEKLWGKINVIENFPTWDDIFREEEPLGIHNPANITIRVRWVNNLRQAVEMFAPKNKAGAPLVSDVDLLTCSLRRRAEALVMTLEKQP